MNLVAHIWTGVKDLFYLPAQGLVESPSDFVVGVGKGAESVVHHALKGTLQASHGAAKSLSCPLFVLYGKITNEIYRGA